MVLVTVNPDGSVKNASLQVSTGDLMKDKEAIHYAKGDTYRAATRNCQPVEGTYLRLVTIATIN